MDRSDLEKVQINPKEELPVRHLTSLTVSLLWILAAGLLATPARADMDLAVSDVQLVQIGSQWGVQLDASVYATSGQSDFEFNLTIQQIRNGTVIATPVDRDIPVVNAQNCPNCAASCYGTCSFIINNQTKSGTCIIQCATKAQETSGWKFHPSRSRFDSVATRAVAGSNPRRRSPGDTVWQGQASNLAGRNVSEP